MKKILILIFLSVAITPYKTSAEEFSELKEVKNYIFNERKLKEVDSSYILLRTFVDYFYLLLLEQKSIQMTFEQEFSFIGHAMGDAHPENFGIQLLKDNKNTFTLNDYDDSGSAPLFYDLLRLLTGADLLMKNNSQMTQADRQETLKDMLSVYALNSQQHLAMPLAIKKAADKSQKNGTMPLEKLVSQDKKKFKDGLAYVPIHAINDKEEYQSVFRSLKKVLPKILETDILDMASYTKKSGGSAFLRRIEILIQLDENILHLELKPIAAPTSYHFFKTQNFNLEKNYYQSIDLFMGEDRLPLYKFITHEGNTYQLRPIIEGNTDVKMDKLNPKELSEVLVFEAWTLSKFHRKQGFYFEKIRTDSKKGLEQIISIIELLSNHFEYKFQTLKN